MSKTRAKTTDLLTHARALTVAQGAETADKNLQEMKASTQELDSTSSSQPSVSWVKSEPIQKINAKKSSTAGEGAQGGVNFHRCGHPSHLAIF